MTPAAGTYKVDFTASVSAGGAATNGDFGLFIAGSEQASCRRSISCANATTISSTVAISTQVTVNGSQQITIQYRENSTGTVTCNAREIILTPISR